MNKRQTEIQPVLGSNDMNVCARASEPNRPRSFAGLLSWHISQPALPALKYALTVSGYVILP